MALLYLRAGSKYYSQGEKYFKLASEKGHIEATNNLGIIYKSKKRYAEAKKYLKKALEMLNQKPDYKSDIENLEGLINDNLGNLYKEMKKYDEAEKYYKQAIKIKFKNAEEDLQDLYKLMKNKK